MLFRPIQYTMYLAFPALLMLSQACGAPEQVNKLLQDNKDPLVMAVSSAKFSVVHISGIKEVKDKKTKKNETISEQGAGVVINPRGYILTNHHVVDGLKQIYVRGYEKTEPVVATLILSDEKSDLALVKINSKERLPMIKIGNSDKLELAQRIAAIGSPWGLKGSVTSGIVSQFERSAEVNQKTMHTNFIQTDAAINPGNSGGALINYSGELIGVVTAKHSLAEGIAFAIPINKALGIVSEALRKEGTNKKAYIGWKPKLTQTKKGNSFVVIQSVDANSPAAKAGIKKGDIIKAVQGFNATGQLNYRMPLQYPHDLELELRHLENKPFLNLLVFKPTDPSYQSGQEANVTVYLGTGAKNERVTLPSWHQELKPRP